MIIYRHAKKSDLKELLELHIMMDKEEKSMGCDWEHKADEKFLKEILADKRTISLVATEEEKIIGFGYGREENKVFLLHNIFILRPYRQKNIGSTIYNKIRGKVKNKIMEAYILKGNKYALAFWLKRGFKKTKELKNAFQLQCFLN